MKKILICGLPDAGKTYLARELQKHLKYSAVIDGDDVRKMYGNDLKQFQKFRDDHPERMKEPDSSLSVIENLNTK